jgi:hypothetical protein
MRTETIHSIYTEPKISNNMALDRPPFADRQYFVPRLDWSHYLDTFRSTIKDIEQRLQIKLPMEGRWVKFVNKLELKPETIEEAQLFVETYGEDILDTTIGDCTVLPGKIFRLRVACYPNSDDNTMLSTLAHEYGHSLSRYPTEATIEELKAQTFEELFLSMQGFKNVPDPKCDNDLNEPHAAAEFYIQQFLTWGVRPEELLYVLVGSPFRRIPEDRIKSITSMLTHLNAKRKIQIINSQHLKQITNP